MKIKYIAWKQVISSDVNRLIYGTQGPGLHNKADQAIQNFNSLNENPGLWRGFTGNVPVLEKPGTNIVLRNSVNPLNIWYSNNAMRKNPIKINHEIWDRSGNHAKRIIETWYLGYMRILEKLLIKIVNRDGSTNNAKILLDFVSGRLSKTVDIRTNILKWIYDTQDGFCNMYLDTSFMEGAKIKDLVGFVEKYYYLVVKCEDNGETFNMALMAYADSPELHPSIRAYLSSNKYGGEDVDIDVSAVAASPDAQRFLDALYSRRNIILYGPPGTGKTHLLTELDRSFNAQVLFDDLDTEAPFRVTGSTGETAKEWCTFHPNYSYESFVYGLEPKVLPGNKLGFKPHIGPMLKLAKKAESGVKSLLIIDEINRANTDAVFGNAVAVIDPLMHDKVTLPQPIVDDEGTEIRDFQSSNNLYIVGTMNSLDKSTSPLSSELKRRFCIVEMSPNVEVLRSFLSRNATIDPAVSQFTCDCMEMINSKVREYCGKEYELGQGYFWGLVDAHSNHVAVLAEILRNKVIPHLRDVLSSDVISEFFGAENIDVLYSSNGYGFEIAECSTLSDIDILNAFARAIGSDFSIKDEEDTDVVLTLEEYENQKTTLIQKQLSLYKNVIITGCSGTGKSYYVSKILESGRYAATAKTHWHSSTEYADVIEGISATINGTDVNYSVQSGAVKKLADEPVEGKRLLVIENITKSNAAENFGELITLLEPDKRSLSISGYEGAITIPEDMEFLCTATPGMGGRKLDSALKRRFSIIELAPDYRALSLRLKAEESEIDCDNLFSLSENELKSLAIELLRTINGKIKDYIGSDAQIGQAAMWGLAEKCAVSDLISTVDDNMLPIIEDLCVDDEITRKIFGDDSPLLKQHNYGLEICRLADLASDDLIEAFRGMLQNA